MKTIYILDDDADFLLLARFLFNPSKYSVESFKTVLSLESQLNDRELPDLFILDVWLPDGNGWTVANGLKSHEIFKNVPILMVSGIAPSSEQLCDMAGDAFLPKPLDIGEFRLTLDKLFAIKNISKHS